MNQGIVCGCGAATETRVRVIGPGRGWGGRIPENSGCTVIDRRRRFGFTATLVTRALTRVQFRWPLARCYAVGMEGGRRVGLNWFGSGVKRLIKLPTG